MRNMTTYIIPIQLLLRIQLTVVLVDPRPIAIGIPPECDIQILQKLIAARQQTFGCIGSGINRRLTIKDNDAICQISRHDEIMLNDEGSLLGVHDEAFDDAGSDDTLFGVEVSAWLVDEVDVCWKA